MKQSLAAVFVTLLVTGCAPEVLDFRNAEVSNNTIYAASENEPFSGTVTHIPLSSMPAPGIAPLVEMVATSSGETNARDAIFGAAFANMMSGGDAVLCDASVENGQLNGEAVCMFGETKFFTVMYDQNTAEGEFTVFDPNDGERVAEGELTGGILTGESRGYSARTGQLVHKTTWVNGKANGPVEVFSSDTGNLVVKMTLKDGAKQGEFVRYAEDGTTLLVRTSFVDDRPHGAYEEYDKSGELVRKTTYRNGTDLGALAEEERKAAALHECVKARAIEQKIDAPAGFSMGQYDELRKLCEPDL